MVELGIACFFLASAVHLSTTTNFWVSCDSLLVLCDIIGSQGCRNDKIIDMSICFAILVRSFKDARWLQDTQGSCKTSKVLRACTRVLCLRMPRRGCPCALLHGCRRNAAKRTTTLEDLGSVRRTDARPHLGQACKSARPSCDCLAGERKTIVRVSYSCLTFRENQHEALHFCLRSALRPEACGKPHSQTIVQLL